MYSLNQLLLTCLDKHCISYWPLRVASDRDTRSFCHPQKPPDCCVRLVCNCLNDMEAVVLCAVGHFIIFNLAQIQVVYSKVTRSATVDLLREHVCHNIMRIGKQWHYQSKGIPQVWQSCLFDCILEPAEKGRWDVGGRCGEGC